MGRGHRQICGSSVEVPTVEADVFAEAGSAYPSPRRLSGDTPHVFARHWTLSDPRRMRGAREKKKKKKGGDYNEYLECVAPVHYGKVPRTICVLRTMKTAAAHQQQQQQQQQRNL